MPTAQIWSGSAWVEIQSAASPHHAAHDAGGADAMTIDAAAATGSLRTLGDTATQAAQGSKRSRILDEVHADAGVASSAAEQTLATLVLPAGVIAVGDTVRFVAMGDQLNNSGSDVTYTWRFKIGTTTVMSTGTALAAATGTTRRKWHLTADIIFPTTTSQRVAASLIGSSFTSNNWGLLTTLISAAGYGTAAEDTASPLNIIVTCQLGTSVSTADVVLHGAYLELVKK